MSGLFQGLELGKRALMTNQLQLQTVGHNIANVNTVGYSRQRVLTEATVPLDTIRGEVGTGVNATNILHVRDLFLGQQYREDSKSLGQWSYKQKTLTQIESLFHEPNENTISDRLNEFWNSWSALSTDPGESTLRGEVIERAEVLINGMHEVADQLLSLQDAIDNDLVNLTEEVNRLTSEIGRINHQIKASELGAVQANDLRDARDKMIDDLSEIIDVRTVPKDNGATHVYIGGMVLVDDDSSWGIQTTVANENGRLRHSHVWESSTIEIVNVDGELKGLLDSRDAIIPDYLEKLDQITRSIVEEVNAMHRTGYAPDGTTGVDFFDPRYLTAATVRLDPDLDSLRVAAALNPEAEESDGGLALAIAGLQFSKVMESGASTINDFYGSVVGSLGVESHEATSFVSNYELLRQNTEANRQSIQGVSLDEEMANLVKFQHAYDAAARVITTMDEALNTVISSMGIVGR